MGTDIHVCVEYNKKDGLGWWNFATGVHFPRNYDLFTAMADVRRHFDNAIEPVSEPRGLPEDVFDITREYLQDFSEHSSSWLTLGEFLEATVRSQGPHPEVLATVAAMKELEKAGWQTRLVFGFDS